jgi:uncharacterized protein (DUF433 family)
MISEPPQGTPCLRGRVAIPWDDIPGVKGMLDDGKTVAEIADFFGVSRASIYSLIKINDKERKERIESRRKK